MSWYSLNKRDLPWRRTKDAYRIWVSEIMLQQTTVNTVIPYYERWLKAFPTVHELGKAPLAKVLKLWQGLGYYNRARNMHQAARRIIDEHQGRLPQDPVRIRSLPGFGPYTTGSVLSIAYDLPMTIIDANVRRVAMRLMALEGPADTGQDAGIEVFLLKVLPKKKVGDFNQALMELGALICRPKEPICLSCPVQKYCKAYRLGRQEIIPKPRVKIIKDIHAVIAVIEKNGKYFIQQRPSRGLLADLWEFPGGKIEAGEAKTKALARELKEELGVGLLACKHLFDVKHFYTQFRVNLSVFACSIDGALKTGARHRWVILKDFAKYPMPSGTAKIVQNLHNLRGCGGYHNPGGCDGFYA